jgi:hypothetical protein
LLYSNKSTKYKTLVARYLYETVIDLQRRLQFYNRKEFLLTNACFFL